MLLKQIFIHEGKPIRMHIDSSIANVNVRATLATRIMVSPRIFLHLYRWANEVDRGWPRGAQEGQDGLVGVHGCSGLNACMAAFWRRSHGEAQSARVILADPNTEIFQHLVKTYQGEPDKYVESYLWVKKCVEKGQVIYTPVIYKNPGGRRPGEEYVL